MQVKKTLDFQVLSEHFHLPMVEVAKKFGICTTVFKRMCRTHGIKRWPFRKLQSIERRMFALKENFLLPNSQEAKELSQLAATKTRIMATGRPCGPGERDEEIEQAGQVEIAKNVTMDHGGKTKINQSISSDNQSISYVTLSGCQIGITLGAVQQLMRLFWPTGEQNRQ
eukprot:TRINITY_DN26121_c0_g1_i2.p1 TRINITY_DN26121_c0_g1~~TRINITY_DN26121_c0_g1_i2.p1  ORF type:complete len:169 (+),score=45.12 TRINITY_DN26121_c0_g1_i2:215-721(+)